MKIMHTKNLVAIDLVFGVALGFELNEVDAWRSVWDRSDADREELRGWKKFAKVKEIVEQFEAEDASAAALLAVDATLEFVRKTNGAEVKP